MLFFPLERSNISIRHSIELPLKSDVRQVEDEIRKPAEALCV
jgi:hypothetical protein